MRFAVIGSRSYNNKEQLNRTLSFFIKNKGDVVVSGGAAGADKLGAEWAIEKGFEVKEYIPDWDKYGKGAGFRRNADIINDSDMVICFWDGISKGTANSIGLAKDKKKPTFIVYF
jgi:hypothetical protein